VHRPFLVGVLHSDDFESRSLARLLDPECLFTAFEDGVRESR